MIIRHPNRLHATKNKKRRACPMCKHYKRGWSHNFKSKQRDLLKRFKKTSDKLSKTINDIDAAWTKLYIKNLRH